MALLLEILHSITVVTVLVKVQYPGPDGTNESFDAEVPDPPPRNWTFKHPVDGSDLPATLVNDQGSHAIYRADPTDKA